MTTGATETIFALSTASGRAALAVLRISGTAAAPALKALTAGKALPVARRASLRRLSDPKDGAPLDEALVLWLPGPGTFTGEDTVELHLHGGRSVVAGVIAALEGLPGLRPAEPGEFTRRAFDVGRLDLSEVEGLADLIAAETAAQRRQAIAQLQGALSARLQPWRDALLRMLAHFEAAIDFVDEDLPEDIEVRVREEIAALRGEIEVALADGGRGERLRDGFRIAILGAPNAGKSSLLNALAGREAAIVSEVAGTTRDVVEVQMDLGGYPVTFSDTAGLRPLVGEGATNDPVEREGMRRAQAAAEAADLQLVVFDLTQPPPAEALALLGPGDSLALLNKADLVEGNGRGAERFPEAAERFMVSVKTGQGLDALFEHVTAIVSQRLGEGPAPAITRARHRRALEDALEALVRAEAADLPELLAEDLRLALRALGRVTGQVDVEDLLDVIFRDFCIGK